MEENLDGVDVLCAIGGDGTIHELCNGMLMRKDGKSVPLGFLPGGSGNSVMCDFGTWSIEAAAERVANGTVLGMDVCNVTTLGQTIASINELTFGLIGDIGVIAEDFRWMGPERYNAVAAWKLLAGFKQHVSVDITDETGQPQSFDGEYLTVFLNQTQHFGKGMRAVPSALVDDGLVNVVMVESASRGEMLAILQQVPQGRHEASSVIQNLTASDVTLKFDCPGVFNVDGEILKHDGTVHVAVAKRKLQVIADSTAIAGNMV